MAGKRSRSGRSLIYGGVLIVLLGAIVFFLRGNNSPQANAAKVQHQVAAKVHRPAGKHARSTQHKHVRSTQHRHAARHASRPTHRRHVAAKAHHVHHPRGFTQRQQYAKQVLPLLDMSVRMFGQASSATGGAGFSQLGGVCGRYNGQVDLLQQEYSGIPYAESWYTYVGSLHHNIEGVYHYMLGALQQCQTAVANGDYNAAATAKSDISTAAAQMRSQDSYVRWLSNQR